MCSSDLKFQRQILQEIGQVTNDKLPAFRVKLKKFARLVFKLVFRVSVRSVPLDIPVTSKRTDVHNLYVIFKKLFIL